MEQYRNAFDQIRANQDFQDRLILVSQVSGKRDLTLLIPFGEPGLDTCRAQQMSHIRKSDGNTVIYFDHLSVFAGDHLIEQACDIFHVIKWLNGLSAFPHLLTGLPLCFLHLDVCAVLQHDRAEIAGRFRGKHASAESLFIQQGQISRMVDMCMGQEHKIQFARIHGKFLIDKQILPLLHTAIHDSLFIADFQQCQTAGHFMSGAKKCYLQSRFTSILI